MLKTTLWPIGLLLIGLISTSMTVAENLRLNHIQVIGTHNSYHKRPPSDLMDALKIASNEVEGWDYEHAPLDVQLDRGVRSFELDLHPFTDGFAVMHVPIVDGESTCPVFTDCLETVLAWSRRHPRHVPISFLLEFKLDEALLAGKPLMSADAAMLDALDQAILSVFPRENIITPDDVRGNHATLREAVQERGWPELETSLGKVFFVLHNRTALHDAYLEGRPSLQGRVMFVNAAQDNDACAFMVVDNPFRKDIPELLEQGVLIRVRADSGLSQARKNDTTKRDAAFASGAHVVSTDFPPGQAHPDSGYVVAFPDQAPLRCNPVLAPESCGAAIENIELPR